MVHRWSLRRVIGTCVSVLLISALAAFHIADRAGAGESRCAAHRADARERSGLVTGTGADTGQRIAVIGDSWSVGLGLDDLGASWPSRLPGQTRVAGFSGSGFSAGASDCRRVSFADRAAAAVAAQADLVVVQGGLNDFDQPDEAVTRGFDRLMRALTGQRVVVVGPALAPSRAAAVPRVDRLLSRLSTTHGVPYVATSDLELGFLEDGLHLTADGHQVFGDAVAERVEQSSPSLVRRDPA